MARKHATDGRVTLEPAEYERLMRLDIEVELKKTQAALANMRLEQRIAQAERAHEDYLRELAAKYPALKPTDAAYRADEATHSLVPQGETETKGDTVR